MDFYLNITAFLYFYSYGEFKFHYANFFIGGIEMAKEFTKSYAINRIAELTEFIKQLQNENSDLKAKLANMDKNF